jgi:hypothetical protein
MKESLGVRVHLCSMTGPPVFADMRQADRLASLQEPDVLIVQSSILPDVRNSARTRPTVSTVPRPYSNPTGDELDEEVRTASFERSLPDRSVSTIEFDLAIGDRRVRSIVLTARRPRKALLHNSENTYINYMDRVYTLTSSNTMPRPTS